MSDERVAGADGSALRPLRTWWWVILLTVGASMGVSAWLTARQKPVYRATTTLVVTPIAEITDTGDVLRSLDTLERRGVVATIAKIPSAPETMDAVARRLDVDPASLRGYSLSASVPPYTFLLKVECTGRDPKTVAEVADAAGRVLDQRAREFYRIFTLPELAAAERPRGPIHPQPRRNQVVAALLGLFVGVVAAYGFDGLRGRRT